MGRKEEQKELKKAKKLKKKEAKKNRTGKEKFIDRFLKFVILVGILFVLYIPIRNFLLNYFSSPKALTPEIVETNLNKPFHTEEIAPVTDKGLFSGINWNQVNIIGAIYMPDISTATMISRGFTDESMYTSVGTMTENQTMGKGNYPLAGHNMFVPKLLFTDIDKLNNGNIIYLTDATYVYTYEVNEVLPRAKVGEVTISGDRGKDEVTLMSCTDDAYTDDFQHRKVTRGKFIKKELVKDAPEEVLKVFKLK